MTHILGKRTKPIFICRGCGCDDEHACPGGCEWVLLDIPEPGFPRTGVCSSCAEIVGWEFHAMASMGFEPAQLRYAERG